MAWQFAQPVTPSDSTEIDFRSLWIGGAGNVAIRDLAGNTVTFSGALAGSYLLVKGDRVMSSNTTATNIVALN